MKNFYNQVISSVYNPLFYKNLNTKKSSFTIIYTLKLITLASVVSVVVVFLSAYFFKEGLLERSGATNVGDLGVKYVENYFADDLVITFKDGILKTNKSEPVLFPLPIKWLGVENYMFQGVPKNLLTIDPGKDFEEGMLEKYDTIAVLASSSVGFINNDKTETVDYKDLEKDINNIVLNKNIAKAKAQEISSYTNSKIAFFSVLSLIFIFLFTLVFGFLGIIIFALFTGLIAYIIARLNGTPGSFGSWYLKAIHADTLYVILSYTLGWIFPLSMIPFLNTLIVIVILLINKNFDKAENTL